MKMNKCQEDEEDDGGSSSQFHPKISSSELMNLPFEILWEIIGRLETKDVLEFSFSCKKAHILCQRDEIWLGLLKQNFCFVPTPKLRLTPKKMYFALKKSKYLIISGSRYPNPKFKEAIYQVQSALLNAGLPQVHVRTVERTFIDFWKFLEYDAILLFSMDSSSFWNGEKLGNELLQYLHCGGGLVVAVFSMCSNLQPGGCLFGEITSHLPFQLGPQQKMSNLQMEKVHNHPILNGVHSLKCQEVHVGAVSLNPKAKLILSWENENGKKILPLVAEMPFIGKKKANVVAVNIFPPWNTDTNGARLMANCLQYVNQLRDPSKENKKCCVM